MRDSGAKRLRVTGVSHNGGRYGEADVSQRGRAVVASLWYFYQWCNARDPAESTSRSGAFG